MDELINRITTNVGIDADTAREAVRIILSFLYQQGDREKVAALAESIPGRRAFIDEGDRDDSAATLGGLGGLMGGGAMAVLGKLQAHRARHGRRSRRSPRRRWTSRARRPATRSSTTSSRSIPGLGQFV